MSGDDHGAHDGPREGYPAGWWHATIHLNPATGEMHSDGDHRVRTWIADRLPKSMPPPTAQDSMLDGPVTIRELADWLVMDIDRVDTGARHLVATRLRTALLLLQGRLDGIRF